VDTFKLRCAVPAKRIDGEGVAQQESALLHFREEQMHRHKGASTVVCVGEGTFVPVLKIAAWSKRHVNMRADAFAIAHGISSAELTML